eukprot:4621193-Pyramimonas_sp.AAC.1
MELTASTARSRCPRQSCSCYALMVSRPARTFCMSSLVCERSWLFPRKNGTSQRPGRPQTPAEDCEERAQNRQMCRIV